MSSKMNLTSSEAAVYLDRLVPLVADVADRELFTLLPFPALWVARDRLAPTNVRWGAQDVHADDSGAHTGDVSAPMLADLGCTYVEVGHQERRRDHGETDALVSAKVRAIQRWGMTALLCVGEVARASLDVVAAALDRQLQAADGADLDRLVIAYEPAWAIGVGSAAAEPDWVAQAHAAIRSRLTDSSPGLGAAVPILYGGSVTPDDAADLLRQPGVDGLFVGRQALDPVVFARIAHVAA
jgi:triosephosphate isomerase